ncbi:DUF3108 domain-containing protein [Lysobacter pythonis]|uniref:DUF3108 domain-containing protein n=1 Tax=Solilutibacter pythonis TaxID=2483112 RepID=A0A3M2HWK6_9GAMM|nr:DUF3108 domain-containing protein [Lysobacter pythonis]RMH94106.1 DUF3108 domain-containing protein [Lysobacter pythonis]
MHKFRSLPLNALLLAPLALAAGQTPSSPVAPAAQTAPAPALTTDAGDYRPYELRPFVGAYQVFRAGKPLGNATMRLVNTGGARWRIDLNIVGTQGVAGMAGMNIQQSTVFDVQGEHYRPISQSTVRNALFATRKTVGVYDWGKHSASWSGDVKKSRRGRQIALQEGDMSGLLINLALMRDARPGKALQYRFVDDARLRTYQYTTAPATENIAIGEISYDALRVERSNGGNDQTKIWVTQVVPLPVRIYLKDGDDEALDLLLINYKGA